MAAPTSKGKFKVEILTLTNGHDCERYEEIMQSAKVDGDKRYEIIEEKSSWTQEGDFVACIKYIEHENPEEQQERF
jgi:hypothetical protein